MIDSVVLFWSFSPRAAEPHIRFDAPKTQTVIAELGLHAPWGLVISAPSSPQRRWAEGSLLLISGLARVLGLGDKLAQFCGKHARDFI